MVDPAGDGREPVEVLAEEFLQRRRRGETPSLKEYVARYPHLAEEIRELFPALVLMDDLDPDSGELSRPGPGAAPVLQQLGDYRLLREIGRGGMGIVYEAEQISLGRRVALKVLLPQALGDARAQDRFRREARSAARLHHTNIVPIFEVGQQGDVCFYAMQLIAGQGLDQVVREVRRLRERSASKGISPSEPLSQAAAALLSGTSEAATLVPDQPRPAASTTSTLREGPSSLSGLDVGQRPYFRSVARVGQQTAQALAHAHARGIVHRDVKPSNLLLDESGVVWVTDFGLAKTEDDNLTRTGDLPGTLRYMAPERFEGQCDARADIYALGLTLYEMLLLAPAFPATDRMQLLEQIRNQEPPRPRALDDRVPRDLETVVLKAIDKDPRRRYASAEELAEDLRRFLADEPIRARRARLPERLLRWCRRNPTVAGLTTAVFVLLAAVAAVASVGLVQSSQTLAREADQRQRAEQEREAARAAEARAQRVLYDADMQLAAQLWESPDGSARAVLSLLEAHRAQEALLDFAWHYQWRLCHDALTLPNHRGTPSVAFTADGHLITFDESQVLRRWDQASGTVVRTWTVPRAAGVGYHWDLSADGAWLALGTSAGEVSLYDTATGRARPFVKDLPAVVDLSFAADGRKLGTIHADGKARIWEVRDGKKEATIALQSASFSQCALGPGGDTLLICGQPGENQVSLYSAGAAAPLVCGLSTSLGCAACSPDGRWLVAGDSIKVGLWEAATGKPAADLHVQAGGVYAMAFSPDGTRLAMGGVEGLVTVWDVATRQRLLALKGHTARVSYLRFAADGKALLSGSADGTARLWELDALEEAGTLVPPRGPPAPWLAYSRDGRWLAVAGQPAQLFDAHTRRPVRQLVPAVRLAFSPDSRILALGDAEARVHLCDVATGRVVRTVEGQPGEPVKYKKSVGGLAFSPDGKLLAAGFGWAQWWDADHEQVARVWDVASGQEVRTLAHKNIISGVAFCADGTLLATTSHEGAVRLWSVEDGQEMHTWKGAESYQAVAFAPQGDVMATDGPDFTIDLREARSRRLLATLRGHSYIVAALAFSPDGRTLASASWDRTIKLWDVASGRELRTLTGHTNWVHCVAFAPDGRVLASCDQSGGVRLWDTRSRRQLRRPDQERSGSAPP